MKKLVIIGAGGHGKVVADIAKLNGFDEIVFLDDNNSNSICNGFSILGKVSDYLKFSEYSFFVAIGNPKIREKFQLELINNGLKIETLIHPNAVISPSVKIGRGTAVMAGVVINAGVKIGEGCIINTSSSIDHECVISDYVHISVGSHLAGNVNVGKNTWVGIGAIIKNNIDIIKDCTIGAGAVVVKNICETGTYIGVPARKI